MKRKTNSLISTLLLVLLITSVASVNTNLVSAVDDTRESKYLVLTESDSALFEAEKLSSKSKNVFMNDDTKVSKVYLSKSEVNVLKNTDGVIAVEKDIAVLGSTNDDNENVDVTDYLFKNVDTDDLNLWYLEAVGSANVDNGDKVKIEILDSGVNYSSDIDIKDRVNLISGNDFSPLYEDFSGHGTSIASVIGAKNNGKGVTGINPNAELYSVRVLDDNIKAPISRIVEGIQWGIDNDMDIINMSFGTNTNSAILREVIQRAYEKGIILVSATGNDANEFVKYPAAYPEVIAVGSMNEKYEISDFTSVGEEMDVVAPGEKIETAGIFGTINGISGTSISTAEVSAVASKILEKDNSKSPDFVKGLILASAKKIQDKNITTGAVDSNYALEIYDEYENSYTLNNDSYEYVNPNEITVYDTDGIVAGLWGGNDHAELVVDAKECLSLTTNQLNLIKAGTRAADFETLDGFKGFSDANAFHGTGNYVANLRCALKFVEVMRTKKDIEIAYNQAIALAKSLPAYNNISDANLINEMLDRFYLLDILDFSQQFNVNDNLGASAIKYKALGLSLHIVGDIYAHRVRVPKKLASSFTDTNFFKELSSFSATTVENKQELVDAAQKNDVPTKLRYMQPLQTSVSYGVVEFRDIKRYCKQWYTDNKCGVNAQYEDNSSFYYRRYGGAEFACSRIICDATDSGGFDLDYWNLIPVKSDSGTSIKLASFKSYVAAAGFDTSELSNVDWDLCTMYPKKVDSNGNIVNK
ncbi:MAG: S8 family serine peptidase [Ruminococcus sp.]